MHVDRTIALACKAVAEAKKTAWMAANKVGESFDVSHGYATNGLCPGRCTRGEVGLKFARTVGVFVEIVAVGIAVAKQHVHHTAGQRAVGAGLNTQEQIGLFGGRIAIGVDHHQARTALVPGGEGVAHDIDLSGGGIGAPDYYHIGVGHFARVDTRQTTGAGHVTIPRQRGTDGGMLAGIALGMAQAIDAITHHQAHGAGIEIGPHRLRTVALFGREEGCGDFVQCVVPADGHELAAALGAATLQGGGEAVGMMDAFGVARDLAADHASGVAVVTCAAHPSNGMGIEFLDLQRAG